MNKKYKIEICRIVYTYKTFEVESENERKAFEVARTKAEKTDPNKFETRGISYSPEEIECLDDKND